MKKVFTFLAVILFLASTALPSSTVLAQNDKPEPDYAKWGKMALEETKKRYPDSEIGEYEFQDRKNISPTERMDTFEFLVKQDGKEKTVKAEVTYNPQTEKLISINIWEKR